MERKLYAKEHKRKLNRIVNPDVADKIGQHVLSMAVNFVTVVDRLQFVRIDYS